MVERALASLLDTLVARLVVGWLTRLRGMPSGVIDWAFDLLMDCLITCLFACASLDRLVAAPIARGGVVCVSWLLDCSVARSLA